MAKCPFPRARFQFAKTSKSFDIIDRELRSGIANNFLPFSGIRSRKVVGSLCENIAAEAGTVKLSTRFFSGSKKINTESEDFGRNRHVILKPKN